MKKGETLELAIEKVIFGGQGLARVDGFAVFVENTIPGDRVQAQIFKKKKRFAEARLVQVIEPSHDRIQAPCRYSGICGGCKWQFCEYEKQLEYKREHVIDSLERIGKLEDVPVRPAIPSPKRFAYRNKMEFSFSDRRWLLPEELGSDAQQLDFALGLHVSGTFYKILDIEECLLQDDTGNNILRDVRDYALKSGIPVYGIKTHVGFWRFLMLRYSHANNEWMVNIVTSEEMREAVQPLADMLAQKYKNIASVVNNINARKGSIAVGEEEILLYGRPTIEESINGFVFEISANSFFQTNTLGAEKLYATVEEYAGLTGAETVVDLYSGTGTIPIFLSRSARKVIGIEIVESAIQDAERNCKRNNISNCEFLRGDIKDLLPGISEKPDVMVIDPPRSGMHPDVVKQVCALASPKIVYVSCNPATLARDLELLKEYYHVAEVQPVDMFPHTFHIESVARLERK
ncbi:MAG: 23S rRNA (uracil(1939)-C(5))-methyltransferase RlmD [Pseudomonadota bacterium]